LFHVEKYYSYKPKGASPRMFSLELWGSTGSCFGLLEWFIGGGQLTATGLHAA
jgi:hypothetical protein